jgi:transcriptional regulator with XRE-family HTH domain
MKGETQLQRNLIYLREQRRYSQERLSKLLGIGRSSLDYYEGRKGINSEPNTDALKRYSDFFCISIDDLVRIDISKKEWALLKNKYREIQSYLKMK